MNSKSFSVILGDLIFSGTSKVNYEEWKNFISNFGILSVIIGVILGFLVTYFFIKMLNNFINISKFNIEYDY